METQQPEWIAPQQSFASGISTAPLLHLHLLAHAHKHSTYITSRAWVSGILDAAGYPSLACLLASLARQSRVRGTSGSLTVDYVVLCKLCIACIAYTLQCITNRNGQTSIPHSTGLKGGCESCPLLE